MNTECFSEEDGGCWFCLCLLKGCYAVYFRGTQWEPLKALSSQWQAGRKLLQVTWLLVFSWWETCLHLWCVLCSNHLKKVGGIQTSLHRKKKEVIRESAISGKFLKLHSSRIWKCNHWTLALWPVSTYENCRIPAWDLQPAQEESYHCQKWK